MSKKTKPFRYPEVGVPLFWPFAFLLGAEEAGLEMWRKNLEFLEEVEKTEIERPPPTWATKNEIALELHTLRLRNFSPKAGKEPVTLVLAPYAGHTSVIADFHKGQSLVETLIGHGAGRVLVTDWKSATDETKNYDIDNYLAELNVCVDDLGVRVNLVGLCQGGWLGAMYAARYPEKVQTLVLAGSPIDTDAGKGEIGEYAHTLPAEAYEELVAMGGGVLKGEFMLAGFKSLHPAEQYFEKYVDLYEHIDDPTYRKRFEAFERWYEYTIDLPGTWYLQAVTQLFQENRLFGGTFVGLGRKLSLRAVTCPVYLLAGEDDDITPKEQVFHAAKHLEATPGEVVEALVPGGHIGLFMGRKNLADHWPEVAGWIRAGGQKGRR